MPKVPMRCNMAAQGFYRSFGAILARSHGSTWVHGGADRFFQGFAGHIGAYGRSALLRSGRIIAWGKTGFRKLLPLDAALL